MDSLGFLVSYDTSIKISVKTDLRNIDRVNALKKLGALKMNNMVLTSNDLCW